ncbi:MAG: ABC transporter substrate-binding protein, partial [Chloroflexi bacterium]|nr:ABC transporter substrate-binding protein [Chloroflexota bacterium]
VPQYGGTLLRAVASDPTAWGPFPGAGNTPLTMQELWGGDWSKGPAGGYGTAETDWAHNADRFDRKVGLISEDTKWTFDIAKDEATIVYKIRQGIRYGLNPNSEASRLVNGRELTADDVVFVMKQRISDPDSYVYRTNPETRVAVITKTGPWEVTVKVPASALMSTLNRLNSTTGYYPPEVFQKYNKMAGWKDQVGTAAFMLTEYIPGSLITYTKNPNFWEKDPVGPGKGNQLPYLDRLQNLIIPDASTRQAALRTAKIDNMTGVSATDAEQLRKQAPGMRFLERTSVDGRGTPVFPRIDQQPFSDVRVRRAMMMGIDYQALLRDYRGGKGQMVTYPFADTKDYHTLFLGLEEPDTPASIKELFSYNPDKAKQLLKEAGYPNGFKTSLLLSSANTAAVDYYSVIKDMWAKIGIELTFDLRDPGTYTNMSANRQYAMITGTTAPAATFYLGVAYQGTGQNANLGNLNDPVVNAALIEVRVAALTDVEQAMKVWREKLAKYVLDQAFAIPDVLEYNYAFWWPWLANYSGESTVSYAQTTWPNYVWYDRALKKSMGY